MRIDSIALEWFRGAADPITLDSGSKSLVVYGENGSGKSSFVDAVEYVLNGGKLRHLTHEYSGRQQEKGVINTHTPEGKKTLVRFKFGDGSELTTEINQNGTFTNSGAEAVAIDNWDCRRTILRQDEVAAFIHDTKGEKYSALLPLLGLQEMEIAAENLRQLAKSVEQQSDLSTTKVTLKQIAARRKAVFGAATDTCVLEKIEELHVKYCADTSTTTDPISRCSEVESALNTQLNQFSAVQRKHLALQNIAELVLKEPIDVVRSSSINLAGSVDPLIQEKLRVLLPADGLASKLQDEKEIVCPACGRTIPAEAFQAHVTAEKKRLQDIISMFKTRKAAVATLCDVLKALKSNANKSETKPWRDDLAKGTLGDGFAYLDGLDVEALRTSCAEKELKGIESKLLPVIAKALAASKDAPPDVAQLSADKQAIETGKAILKAKRLAATAARAEVLVAFLKSLEQGVREDIKTRSRRMIDEISSDIQNMWAILHPGEKIEDVRLYVPEDADKAIDIGLRFYGVEQDSPRLTLSEGYRNSLGLCIFLALAKHEADRDRPLFLDDVVVSLDRGHRGMIVELLQKEFDNRQVILFTHDREWYAELRRQLDEKKWTFKALWPYESPKIGIRWSARTWTLGDAQAQLKGNPDGAGNTARKIMDIELAVLAERLKLRLPYLHREKNDHRTAHDFLFRLIADGKKCFKKRGSKDYEPYDEAIEVFREADKLLLSWGNTASHSFDVVPKEAQKLIAACERTLELLSCPNCAKPVYKLDAGSAQSLQCECGHLRWRYGKA